MCPENPEETRVIIGSMNIRYDIYLFWHCARARTHNLFHNKHTPVPLGHSDGLLELDLALWLGLTK